MVNSLGNINQTKVAVKEHLSKQGYKMNCFPNQIQEKSARNFQVSKETCIYRYRYTDCFTHGEEKGKERASDFCMKM